MSFLKKLFGGNQKTKNPDNTKLNYLLSSWREQQSDANYKAVMEEILNGNAYLMLPSVNDNNETGNWHTSNTSRTLSLTCAYSVDGLTVLDAFSDEKSMMAWASGETQYTAMRTQDVTAFCQANNFDRIIINNAQANMFVLERNRPNISTTIIEKETQVLVGTPIKPLSKEILDKLASSFRKVDTIEEAYHYAQSMNGVTNLVLGIKMSVVSDNTRAALNYAIDSVLSNEQPGIIVDIMVLETEDWLDTVRNTQNSLFYKR